MPDTPTISAIVETWLAGPRDTETTYAAMQEIGENAELLEDLLGDCLEVLVAVSDGLPIEQLQASADVVLCELIADAEAYPVGGDLARMSIKITPVERDVA